MSRDQRRDKYMMQSRDRGRVWGRSEYRRQSPSRKRSRSRSPPMRSVGDRGRGRSPGRNDKDMLDENILSEISKLPEPSELWDGQNQDPNFSGGHPPPPNFRPETSNFPNYQPSYSSIYDDFTNVGSAPQAQIPPEIASWNQMSLPPPPSQSSQVFVNNIEDQIKKEAAIESEMRHQKAALSKQREDYIKKAGILKKELDTLKDQRTELRGDAKRSPSPDTKRFLKENTKLQLEIQNKLKTINNVVDMLNGIIGEDAHDVGESDGSERVSSKRKSRSPSGKKFNYVYYDPEMHWCRVCNEFPPTAKDYLNHLHSPAHHKMAAAHMEAPWHTVSGVNEGFPSFPSAPTKRTPIRGLQFFVPSTAWYCKLCDQFIGDLHCASAHLKSVVHSKNYTNFVEQNPHWETDWMSDRQKAFEKSQAANDKPQYAAHTITFHKDGFHTKNKEEPPVHDKRKPKKRKMKRKRSSSTSSSTSTSSSDEENKKKKKKKSKKEKLAADEKTLTEWMSSIQTDRLNENDRKLLDNIKSRLKIDKSENKKHRMEELSEREREELAEARKMIREIEKSSGRDRRDNRDPRDGRESRESRESREVQDPRESRELRDPRESRELRDPRESRELRDPRESRELRDPREFREPRELREQRRSRSPRDKSRRRSPGPPANAKKPELKKMPFIGKMPVYKHLVKPKTEDQKKEEEKKKEDDAASKKRREEMDAEIQKKVAEFKEKIALAQMERTTAIPPPGLVAPTMAAPPFMSQPPPPAQAAQPTLPKDFQEALDIIFPSEVKQELPQSDGLLGFAPGIPPGYPMPLGVPPFSIPGLLPPPQMFGFDMNAPLFQPHPQLYDTHVPLVPSPKQRAQRPKQEQKKQQKVQKTPPQQKIKKEPENGSVQTKNKEELDDLAMLGIDATDVGANI